MSNSQTQPGFFCYDIRGIQGYIFQIPRLRYIVGGSALIDQFDKEMVAELAARLGVEYISSGGGKGTFACTEEQAKRLREKLTHAAHQIGADIRFGFHPSDYSEAVHCADRLFPYLPENLDGHPCPASGLYPVTDGQDVHPIVANRDYYQGERPTRRFETRLLDELTLPTCLHGRDLEFFHSVDSNDKEHPDAGAAGCAALGNRNRWAVICMDGNDMGGQFRAMAKTGKENPAALIAWVRELGKALDECSTTACKAGIEAVLHQWTADPKVKSGRGHGDYDAGDKTILPVRPLVVGGDDIVVLCHAAHAATFVRQACDIFESHSRMLAGKARAKGIELWPATNGRITISAGILYCGTSLPLATAIPYAENLQSSAKKKGRSIKGDRQGEPSPACVDFESVTESMLDAPATRRRREIEFRDGDLEGQLVRLTRRPYTVVEFATLLKDADSLKLPGSILHQLLPGLRAAFHDRQLFRYRLGKHQEELLAALAEEEKPKEKNCRIPEGSRWLIETPKDGKTFRSTDLLDMVLLIQEDRRMAKETAQ